MSDVVVTDNHERSRVEARLDGELAGVVEYRERSGHRVLVHTIVEPAFGGRGIGSALARGALDMARADGVGVVVLCPFVHDWIDKHPAYADLVLDSAADHHPDASNT